MSGKRPIRLNTDPFLEKLQGISRDFQFNANTPIVRFEGEFAAARQSLDSCWRQGWDLDEIVKGSEVETEEGIHARGHASHSGVLVVTE